jgi:hypothetical protein
MVGNSIVPAPPIASGEVLQTGRHKIARWYCIGMTHELQNFLILVCLLVSYPIMPTLAWQERDKHPTLAIIVIALWVFVVPVFVIGSSSTLWAGASRVITAPFGATFSYEPSSEVFQQSRVRLRYAPRWDI